MILFKISHDILSGPGSFLGITLALFAISLLARTGLALARERVRRPRAR